MQAQRFYVLIDGGWRVAETKDGWNLRDIHRGIWYTMHDCEETRRVIPRSEWDNEHSG